MNSSEEAYKRKVRRKTMGQKRRNIITYTAIDSIDDFQNKLFNIVMIS